MQIKILSLIDCFDPNCMGGAARVFYEINSKLSEKGNTVHAICRQAKEAEFEAATDIKYHIYQEINGSQLNKISYYKKSIRSLFKNQLKENKPDLIIIHSSSAALGLRNLLQQANIPIIYYFHSPWHKEYELLSNRKICGIPSPWVSTLSAIRKHHEATYLNLASGIVTLSHSMQKIMLKTHNEIKNRPMLINPGAADKNIFSPINADPNSSDFISKQCEIRRKLNLPSDHLIIISSRRLVPRTGIDLLIKAFALIKQDKKRKPLTLLLSGDGRSKEELKRVAVEQGVSENTIFTGHVNEKSLADYYRASDLFVMPTKHLEGFGLSTVEAMACGLPVIGTNIGGTPEILNKISPQLIIPEPSPEAIADKISEFITQQNLSSWREKSLACSDREFSWAKHSDNLLNFYKTL